MVNRDSICQCQTQLPDRYQRHRPHLAGRRLRAQHAGGRHGDLLLPAGDAHAHANCNTDTNCDANTNCDATPTYSYAAADSDTKTAPNSAPASLTAGELVKRLKEVTGNSRGNSRVPCFMGMNDWVAHASRVTGE